VHCQLTAASAAIAAAASATGSSQYGSAAVANLAGTDGPTSVAMQSAGRAV